MLPGGSMPLAEAAPWPARGTEEEAVRRGIEDAQTPSQSRAGFAVAALLWIHVHQRGPTSVAHFSYVFRN